MNLSEVHTVAGGESILAIDKVRQEYIRKIEDLFLQSMMEVLSRPEMKISVSLGEIKSADGKKVVEWMAGGGWQISAETIPALGGKHTFLVREDDAALLAEWFSREVGENDEQKENLTRALRGTFEQILTAASQTLAQSLGLANEFSSIRIQPFHFNPADFSEAVLFEVIYRLTGAGNEMEIAKYFSGSEIGVVEVKTETLYDTLSQASNDEERVEVRGVNFSQLTPGAESGAMDSLTAVLPEKLQHLMDVSLTVSIELGRTKMLVKDILNLGTGSIIELNKMAGETIDIYVNEKKIAEGEVVVIDENFGVRITHLIGQE